jgi:hypothetical protein
MDETEVGKGRHGSEDATVGKHWHYMYPPFGLGVAGLDEVSSIGREFMIRGCNGAPQRPSGHRGCTDMKRSIMPRMWWCA